MGGVSTPIEGLSGDELRRSFLLTFSEWRQRQDTISTMIEEDIVGMSEDDVLGLVRDTIVLSGNLAALASKISLELGLPIQ